MLPTMGLPATTTSIPDVLTERQEHVASLRLHGYSQRAIAEMLNVSPSTIRDDMKKIRAVWRHNMSQSYEDHVANELARYEQLAEKLEPGVERGDWKAIDTAIRLADRRARLLGVDMPVKTEVRVTVEAIDSEIEKLEAKAGLPVLEGEVVEDDPTLAEPMETA